MAAADAFSWPLTTHPVVVKAGRFPLADRDFAWVYRSPTHALHVYGYDGSIRFGAGAPIGLRPGDATLSPAGGATRYHLDRPGHHWCVHFRPAAGGGRRVALPLHHALGADQARAIDAIARMAALLAAPDREGIAAAAAGAALQELLLTIAVRAAAPSPRAARAADAIARAAAWIDDHLAEPLDVPALAHRVGLSPNWFASAFRRRHGMTAQRWQLHRRVAHAQDLLRTTDLPVGRIATLLGFGDSQHFLKRFRIVAGCTPSAWRAGEGGR